MSSRASPSLLFLAALAAAAAQDWGLTGAWELVQPITPAGGYAGPSLAYRGATHAAGCLFVTSNDTDSGFMGVSMYDIARARWEQFPDFGFSSPVGDPATVEVGGQLFVIDETNLNNVYFIDISAARSTVGYRWTVPQVSDGPTGRFGMRFVAWGPIVYAFGGVDYQGATAGTAHNDVWALAAGATIAASFPLASWTQVAADGLANMPPPRVGYSVVAFGTVILMYGGVSLLPTAPAGTLPDVCFTPNNALCYFHHSVWAFTPGNPGPPGELTVTAAQWARLGDNGPAQPAGRFDAIAGALGDQLFVYGGTTAAGPTSELWAYNLPAQAWGRVQPSSPAPFDGPPRDFGYGTGAMIGRHLYSFAQVVDAVTGEPLAGTGQLWRWAPTPGGGGGGTGGGGGSATSAVVAGHTAGIVIGILVGLANLGLLVLLAQNAGVVALPALGGLACGGKPAGAGGYYTAASAGVGAGDYAAPNA
jgi:hypothetical protein